MLEFLPHRFNTYFGRKNDSRFLAPTVIVTFVLIFLSGSLSAQILFSQECFTGGVMAVGINKDGDGSFGNSCDIHWEESFEVRKIYLICYRYGRPDPHQIIINGSEIPWTYDSQVGPELPDQNDLSEYYATHVQDITNQIEMLGDELFIDFPPQSVGGNRGWHSAYLIIQYEAPSITEEVCSEIYIADQRQDQPQDYTFETPQYNSEYPILFSVFGSRLTDFLVDRHRIYLNNFLLGEIWTQDLVNSSNYGVQGHFYYQDLVPEGLNGDTANTTFYKHDAIAKIEDRITENELNDLRLLCAEYDSNSPNSPNCANLVPAFTLTYVPDCANLPDLSELLREYDFCRGDTIQLTTTTEYDTFSWSTSAGISDSTISNPICFADSSQWYTVTMWNEGEEGCGQTIPIFVEISAIPRPANLIVNPSSCPDNSGLIQANSPAGRSPFTYRLDGAVQSSNASAGLSPGTYDYRINSAAGCRWDTTVTVPLDPLQEASFDPFPTTGFSPLFVAFANTSTQATDYQWLIDGVPVSTSEDITYTFPDSGSFEVSLIAYRLEETCADTATFTLRVEPGIQVLMPNIITPNSDGRNDALVAQVQGVASCRWVIYNRWGNEVATGSDGAPFQKVELWKPAGDITAGQYTAVFIAEGLAGQVEKMVFEFTLTK